MQSKQKYVWTISKRHGTQCLRLNDMRGEVGKSVETGRWYVTAYTLGSAGTTKHGFKTMREAKIWFESAAENMTATQKSHLDGRFDLSPNMPWVIERKNPEAASRLKVEAEQARLAIWEGAAVGELVQPPMCPILAELGWSEEGNWR